MTTMENTRKMTKKPNAFVYQHFNATGNKRRKNRKKYFEHDTRTRPRPAASNGTAPIKKIKFNNEINIFETKSGVNADADSKTITIKNAISKKKRAFQVRRNPCNIQTTTKKLQKQLIKTQKRLQKQLNALQEHQREQNHSFLALIHSNMQLQTSAKSDAVDPNSQSTASAHSSPNPNSLTHCSDNVPKSLTDQTKCSIDKMANGNKATTIRAFTCDCKSKHCSEDLTVPKDLCNHHCGCIAKSPANKKLRIHIKKPLLRSIILSTSKPFAAPLNIKREIDDDEHPLDVIDSPAVKTPELPTDMQYSDTKKTKQINSYFKANDFMQQNARSYSPPIPAPHKLASMISNDSNNTGNSRRSQTSRGRKSSKKRKKRRRSYSKDSSSRSRSYSRSSRSRSRSRTRSDTRSRSYRRRSSRSTSSSSEYYSRRYTPDRKKKSRSSNRDVFRQSSKRDVRCGCSCNCINYCKKPSKHSSAKNKSKSPSNDSAFSSKQDNTSPADSKRTKKSSTSSSDANGSTSKRKPISITSGVLLKQQPIVKLHSSPNTGSDSENEVDDKFDRKYEELLTFETNADERREQRLLKALSDIAAKAKQKIQSITDSNVAKTDNADRNHNERSASKANKTLKIAKQPSESRDERRLERQDSEDRYDNDYSPHDKKYSSKRDSSRRSRRDSSCSSSSQDAKSARSSRSPSIPRRRGSPSFLDRRRITSARKKPIPYQRSSPYDSYDEWESS